MAPYLLQLTISNSDWKSEELDMLYTALKFENDSELKKLDDKIAAAEKEEGETEGCFYIGSLKFEIDWNLSI